MERIDTTKVACMKPASDLCDTCHNNITKIIRPANLPEAEKSECLKEAKRHLVLAKQERELYNMELQQLRKSINHHQQQLKLYTVVLTLLNKFIFRLALLVGFVVCLFVGLLVVICGVVM